MQSMLMMFLRLDFQQLSSQDNKNCLNDFQLITKNLFHVIFVLVRLTILEMNINSIKSLNVLWISNEPWQQILQIVKWMNNTFLNEKWHTWNKAMGFANWKLRSCSLSKQIQKLLHNREFPSMNNAVYVLTQNCS